MSFRKHIPVLFPLLAMMAFMPASHEHPGIMERWVVLKGGTLQVAGSTNIRKFSCMVKDYTDPDTLVFYKTGDKGLVPMSGCLALPVFSFDCMNNAMTNDLRKTLKAKEFPALNIHFLSLKKYPALKPVQETIDGTVYIELTGVSKKFEINYRISMDDQQIIHLVGNQSIKFSDFDLSPPRRLGGMIRASDQLDVEFHINFRAMNN